MKWFTSDPHWGHFNVIKYCNRPFSSVEEMHQHLIKEWNHRVSPQDDVYVLGDWCMNPKWYFILKLLNFKRLVLVLGNHDNKNKLMQKLAEGGELSHLASSIDVVNNHVLKLQDKEFYMTHRPINCSDVLPTLCGHVHEKWQFMPVGSSISEYSRSREAAHQVGTVKVTKVPILNVGVDVHDYRPINEEEVLSFFK